MVAGHLREMKGYYYIVLSYVDAEGKRRTPTKSTGLPVKGNKRKAEKMLMEARIAMSEELERQKEEKAPAQEQGPSDILFSQFMRDWLDVKHTTVDLTTYAYPSSERNSRSRSPLSPTGASQVRTSKIIMWRVSSMKRSSARMP